MSAPGGIACVVMAAGEGRRFGEPKAQALLRPGVRFVDAVAETARAAGLDPIIIVGPAGLVVPAGCRAIVSSGALTEQITSVRLALATLVGVRLRGAMLWPVDHPFVLAETARALMDASEGGAPIVLPVCEGRRGHPAFFARQTWGDLMIVSDGGARSVVRSYAGRLVELPTADRGVLMDIDTRGDLDAAMAGR